MIQDHHVFFSSSIMHRLINAEMHEIDSFTATILMKAATVLDQPLGSIIAANYQNFIDDLVPISTDSRSSIDKATKILE